MEDRQILEDAKKTIENIKQTQGALDQYLVRLEAIVRKLEDELYKDEKLTVGDITSINKQLNPEMFEELEEEEEEPLKKKKKFRFNIILFISILSFLLTFFVQYVRLNEMVTIGNTSYIIYEQVNMEPQIKLNSVVIIDNDRRIQEQDVIAYYTKHKKIQIKTIDSIEDNHFVIKNIQQTIKAYENVNKNDVIGVVKESHHKIGDILATLSQYILILYLISFLTFIIGILIN